MLPKTAEYALRAAVWLARQPGRAESADELAEHLKTPRRYLHKVLQDMVRAELVRSQPGPRGGYALAVAPEAISILDVVNAVSGVERITHCPLGLPSHKKLCPLHAELDRAYASVEAAFGRVTLAELLHSTNKTPPLCEITLSAP